MTERLIVLAIAAGAGLLLLGIYSLYRKRLTGAPDFLRIDELGLELMSGCCAFVVFTSPSCRPCKSAIQVVTKAMADAPNPTELVTIDATERPEIALHHNVRTIPTVFLITASGHVVERWVDVPTHEGAAEALARI